MAFNIITQLKHGWNAFLNRDPTESSYTIAGSSYGYRPDRAYLSGTNERSIVASVINRIALDAAAVSLKHCKLDENERYKETIYSGLHDCINVQANIDQTGRAFLQDVYITMMDEGHAAVVPTDTTFDPKVTGSYDITSMRVGKVVEWKQEHVKVRLYNEKKGKKEDIWLPKKVVALPENPFFAVMNAPNSTMKRLTRKLSLLDVTDEKTATGKLDMIIQLPYTVKGERRTKAAADRLDNLQKQLNAPGSYGIGYIESTEKVTQLNRPIENNLLKQVEYLTDLMFSQLGMTQSILDGTADEKTMLNYNNRIVEVIVSALVDEMKRKFLTKTARTKGHSIMAFRDHFRLVPMLELAKALDILCRNEVTSSNEGRQFIGLMPSSDPKADMLRNSNMPHPEDEYYDEYEDEEEYIEDEEY